jgi:hypothetical protein
MFTALLREACGLSIAEVAARAAASESAVRRALTVHRKLLPLDEGYAARAAEIIECCVAPYRMG